LATSRYGFGKTYLTSSRKIYFAGYHRNFYNITDNNEQKNGVERLVSKRQKIKVKSAGQNVKISHKWTTFITIGAFLLSVMFSAATLGADSMGVASAIIMLLVIVLMGIVFDVVGVAVSTASEPPFHAMAAQQISGAKESIVIIRHAQQISSFCNDVIGDIAGIVSGAMAAAIVVNMVNSGAGNATLWNLIIAGLVAALMIGGKAAGKGIAMTHNNTIVFVTGKAWHYVKKMWVFGRKK